MRKLKLHLDDLAVNTFHTLPEAGADGRGTLIGHQAAQTAECTTINQPCLTQIKPTDVNCPTGDCPTTDCFTHVPATHYCDTIVCLTGTGA
jgi:hypothetical protein